MCEIRCLRFPVSLNKVCSGELFFLSLYIQLKPQEVLIDFKYNVFLIHAISSFLVNLFLFKEKLIYRQLSTFQSQVMFLLVLTSCLFNLKILHLQFQLLSQNKANFQNQTLNKIVWKCYYHFKLTLFWHIWAKQVHFAFKLEDVLLRMQRSLKSSWINRQPSHQLH